MVQSRIHRDVSQLLKIITDILDDELPPYAVGKDVDKLAAFLGQRATYRFNPYRDIAEGETETDNGLAISPTQAAMCAGEVARTATFLRGVDAAIIDARKLVRNRPVRVLYAGCGPYALLAVPFMARHSSEVQFTLLDIHHQSIDSARSIVGRLGFAKHVEEYACVDACRYHIQPSCPPDIIVSETMLHCLQNEPLVAIARHLLGQQPSAKFVPQRVLIDAWLMDMATEFRVMEKGDGILPVPDRDRVSLGPVFELNAEAIESWSGIDGETLPAASVKIPLAFDPRYEVRLRTTVTVYGALTLKDFDCSLTIPRPIPNIEPITGGELLGFRYRLDRKPRLEARIISRGSRAC